MKRVLIVLALFCIGLSSRCWAVTEITEKDFATAIKSPGQVLVEFYSPTCPFCKAMEPVLAEFEKANPAIPVYRVNGDTEVNLRNQFKLKIKPTYVVFKDSKVVGRFYSQIPLNVLQQKVSTPSIEKEPEPAPRPNPSNKAPELEYDAKVRWFFGGFVVGGLVIALVFSLAANVCLLNRK